MDGLTGKGPKDTALGANKVQLARVVIINRKRNLIHSNSFANLTISSLICRYI